MDLDELIRRWLEIVEKDKKRRTLESLSSGPYQSPKEDEGQEERQSGDSEKITGKKPPNHPAVLH